MATDTVNGIPRVDLHERPRWKRDLNWWLGGKLFTTETGSRVWP